MQAKMEKIEKNIVKFEVTVEAKDFSEALTKSYKKNMKKFNIQGFRKGKVPMALVKQYYGVEVLFEDAIGFAIDATMPKVIAENNITPVDYPKYDIVQIEDGKDFIFTAEVTVYPEVELGEYKGLNITKPIYEVTEEDINAKLKEMQEKNARVETKAEGTVENTDIAVIDFKGFVDGEAFEGGEGTDYSLEIGSRTFIDNFEEQLIGKKVGEEVEVNVTFPESYGKEDLNGKPAKFEVTIKEIKAKELPTLDDEFAQEVSEFDTLEELKADTKANLEKANKEKEDKEFEENVIKAVVENAKIDIPQVMIEKEIDSMIKNLETRLQYQGLNLEQYYQFTGTDAEKTREYMKENAEIKVKTGLVLEAIEKAEDFKVTEEELKAKAEEVAKMYSADGNKEMVDMLFNNQREALEMDVKRSKTVDFLLENNK